MIKICTLFDGSLQYASLPGLFIQVSTGRLQNEIVLISDILFNVLPYNYFHK